VQTIAEAFAAWTQIEAQRQDVDDDTCTRFSSELSRIEQAAIQMPVTSALDSWRLLAMTVTEDGDIRVAGDALFRRARAEIAPKEGDTLATVFAAWLGVVPDEAFNGLAIQRNHEPVDQQPVDRKPHDGQVAPGQVAVPEADRIAEEVSPP
jgi:hypothetical protein